MPFPRKFQRLIETTAADVEAPDYLWLTYAVCAVDKASCGWGGWMIEGAFKRSAQRHATGTGYGLVSAVDSQICPSCGGETFRTAVSLRVEPSVDQRPPVREGIDYAVAPIEYEDQD